jgi:phosphohistidine phosphatase
MYIFIMRHGEAENIVGEDSLRPLAKKGYLETEKMGFWLTRRKPELMNIFVSPYLRAQQSCKSVCKVLNNATLLNGITSQTIDCITPSGNAQFVHDFIDGLLQSNEDKQKENNSDNNHAILLVSHMPFVSYLVGELTESVNMPIFSTGAIAVIDYDIKKMNGQLIEMVAPSTI